jgi:hypothetical protein
MEPRQRSLPIPLSDKVATQSELLDEVKTVRVLLFHPEDKLLIVMPGTLAESNQFADNICHLYGQPAVD